MSQSKHKRRCDFSQKNSICYWQVFCMKRMFQALVCKMEGDTYTCFTGSRKVIFVPYSITNHWQMKQNSKISCKNNIYQNRTTFSGQKSYMKNNILSLLKMRQLSASNDEKQIKCNPHTKWDRKFYHAPKNYFLWQVLFSELTLRLLDIINSWLQEVVNECPSIN
jgi:hypothetical protein